jgi:serine/threonine protein kinase
MKCPKCQTENIENSRFCNQCATSLVFGIDKSPEEAADKLPKAAADESPDVVRDEPAEAAKATSPYTSQVKFSEATRTIELGTRSFEKGTIVAEKYRIVEKLGEGGMGIVYKALDMTLNRDVALKFLPPEYTRDKDAQERFIREAKSASALDHPNICTIHEINKTEDEQVFIVMAYHEGQSLKGKIRRGPMKQRDVIDIAIQVTRGISAAHKKGIIHRDVKPSNIMITSEGVVTILDF